MKKEAIENVHWRQQDIDYTASKVVGFYFKDLPAYFNRFALLSFGVEIHRFLENEGSGTVEFGTDAFDLVFEGPGASLIPVIGEDGITWKGREPRMVFYDHSFSVLAPRSRNELFRLNRAIAEEVRDVYALSVSENPFSFIFPKAKYASRIEIIQGVVLNH